MAVIKPETTGYGMYFIYFPKPKTPNIIWNKPANKNTNNIKGKARSKSPLLAATIPAIITIDTAVIGAVGPDICVFVPPKSEAKNPIIIAPYSPALGPRPDCTPKASASGKATIPAVIPPNKLP